jgi:hypothetical protein
MSCWTRLMSALSKSASVVPEAKSVPRASAALALIWGGAIVSTARAGAGFSAAVASWTRSS